VPAIPFYVQVLLVLAAFAIAAGVVLALLELSDEALDEQAPEQIDGEVADAQPVAAVASEIRVSHGSQF